MPEDAPGVDELLAAYPAFMRMELRPSAEVAVRATGMAVADAHTMAQTYGVTAFEIDADNPPARTMELTVNCVTLWVRQGIVTRVSIG